MSAKCRTDHGRRAADRARTMLADGSLQLASPAAHRHNLSESGQMSTQRRSSQSRCCACVSRTDRAARNQNETKKRQSYPFFSLRDGEIARTQQWRSHTKSFVLSKSPRWCALVFPHGSRFANGHDHTSTSFNPKAASAVSSHGIRQWWSALAKARRHVSNGYATSALPSSRQVLASVVE